jgi:hypothetical protein
VGYILVFVLIIAVIAVLLGLKHVREANAPEPVLPSRAVVRRRAAAGAHCPCGGTVQVMSGRFGDFLGCSNHLPDRAGCNRWWTLDGRRAVRRPSRRPL